MRLSPPAEVRHEAAVGVRATRGDRLGRAGVVLALASVGWIVVSAAAAGGSAWPSVATVALVTLAYLAGRQAPAWAPVAVVVLAGFLILLYPVNTFTSGAGAGPLHYANARGALFVQATVAALMIAFASSGRGRALGLVVAVAFALVPIAARSIGATAAAVGIPLAAVGAARRRGTRPAVVLAGLAIVAAVTVTGVIAAAGPSGVEGGPLGRVSSLLGENRTRLWSDAASLAGEHPIVGVGPGRFDQVSPLAASDPDLRWAHNDFLQQAAETGIPGAALLVLGFGWALARLWSAPAPAGVLAAAGVAALGLQAGVDYVLHFPLIPMLAAGLVGAASSRPREGSLVRRASKALVLPLGITGRRGPDDVSILLYHRVGVGDSEIDLSVAAFEEQMALLAERESPRTLDAALDGHPGVVLTFDDGSPDFHEHVLPVLERYRFPAVLYLATEGVDEGTGDRLAWTQVQEAVSTGLVTVGSHTHRHADLSGATEAQAEEEMRRSKELIEDRLDAACRHFAYPWAVGSAEADRAARRLFDSAALYAWRTNRGGSIDRYRLGRVPILRSDGPLFFRFKMAGMLDSEALLYRALRRGPWRAP